jgi:hypothetical protein
MKWQKAAIVASALVAVACSDSGGSPADPSGQRSVSGQTLSATDSAQAGNVEVQIGNNASVRSDAGGFFTVEVDDPGRHPARLRATDFVERLTTVDAPADGVRLSLIPNGFDLHAFDELARTANARLQRWTSQPSLVVLMSVMRYTSMGDTTFPATAERISDAEADSMVADLSAALELLTAGTWSGFATVTREAVAEDTRVETIRPGTIVVGRYRGVQSLASTIGWGRWSEQGDGTVVGGALYLDRDFDARSEKRNLLRMHELGHALGYLHVTSRTSIMNPAIGPDPTDFDRVAARIVYNRPVGNRSPDEDPGHSGSRPSFITDGSVRLGPPVP